MQEKNKKKLDSLTVYILNALSDSELYGSEIDDKINELSDNTLKVKQATLYNTLKKCEQKGIITSYWKDGDIGGKRHYYLLTDLGKELLIDNKLEPVNKNDDKPSNEFEYFNANERNQNKAFWNNQNSNTNPINTTPSEPSNIVKIQKEIKKENDEIKYSNNNSNTTIWKEDDLRITNNDIISNTIQNKSKVNIQNTDIDYKNILGELYVSDKRTIENINKSESKDEEKVNLNIIEEPKNTTNNISNLKIDKEDNTQTTLTSNLQNNNPIKFENDFSNYGIKVKVHDKTSDLDINNKEYIKTNKINFFISLITMLVFAIELVISYHITKNIGIGTGTQLLPFLIIGLVSLLYPITLGIIFLINPHKKSKNNFDFKQTFLVRLLVGIILIVFVISICFLAGMNNLNQIKYIYFWLIPTLISIDLIIEPLIKKLLLLTKEFDA